jgi:lipoprotein-anchoring transpeptidase ErfK/SrfK
MDKHDRPSTFFTNMQSLQIPESKIHNEDSDHSQQSAEKEDIGNATPLPSHENPKWLMPLAITVITIQILGIGIWFGFKQQQAVKNSVNETISKLKLIEKHGYNVKGYYTQVNEQSEKLNSPLALVQLGSVKGALATIDQQVSTQYSQLLENEKKNLDTKIANLETELTQTSDYSYPSKTEILSYVQQLKEKVSQSQLSIQQVELYEEEIDNREKTLNSDLATVMKADFAELETQMSKATYYNFPSHDAIQEYIQKTGGSNANKHLSTKDVITQIKTIRTDTETVKREVEQEKKNVIMNNVTAANTEVDGLLAFFAQRNGYTDEINQLNQFKNNVASFTPEKTASLTSTQLQKKADTDLMTLLTIPRQSKIAAEAKEKQERLAQQKKLEAEKGIPVPPLDVPKLILVDVDKQRLYAYENGISIFDQAVPITTGKAGFETIRGQFAVYSKYSPFRMRSPFPGIQYDSMVDYVLFFYQGYGIHDASWRSVYGTMDYPAVGSHGCVNTPFAYEKQLYAWAEIGTTVIVK